MPSSIRRRYPTAALILLTKRLHNWWAPISRLPQELVLVIINIVIRDHRKNHHLPFITSPVFRFCDRWRKIALEDPLLWNCIATTSRAEAEIMLGRSRGCDLTLIGPTSSVLELLLPVSARWVHLAISSGLNQRMMEAGLRADAPNLGAAAILRRGHPFRRHLFSGTASKLRDLSLDFFLLRSDPLWNQLVSVTITYAGVLLDEFLSIIESCKTLEHFVLDGCFVEDFMTPIRPTRANRIIHPSQLKYVQFSTSEALCDGGLLLFLLLCDLLPRLPSFPKFRFNVKFQAISGEDVVDFLLGVATVGLSLLPLLSACRTVWVVAQAGGWLLQGSWKNGASLVFACQHPAYFSQAADRRLYSRLADNHYPSLERLVLHGLDSSFPIGSLLLSMPRLAYLKLATPFHSVSDVIHQFLGPDHLPRLGPCLRSFQNPTNRGSLTTYLTGLMQSPMSICSFLVYVTFEGSTTFSIAAKNHVISRVDDANLEA